MLLFGFYFIHKTMKNLHEVVKERSEKEKELIQLETQFNDQQKVLIYEIKKLMRIESLSEKDLNIEKIQLAETVIYIKGNPYGNTSDGITIAEAAIIDISNDCDHLVDKYFGNKTYAQFYQRCDCEYHMGPTHGGICDEIGLYSSVRDRQLTDDEKDASIYYIKNYTKVL